MSGSCQCQTNCNQFPQNVGLSPCHAGLAFVWHECLQTGFKTCLTSRPPSAWEMWQAFCQRTICTYWARIWDAFYVMSRAWTYSNLKHKARIWRRAVCCAELNLNLWLFLSYKSQISKIEVRFGLGRTFLSQYFFSFFMKMLWSKNNAKIGFGYYMCYRM